MQKKHLYLLLFIKSDKCLCLMKRVSIIFIFINKKEVHAIDVCAF